MTNLKPGDQVHVEFDGTLHCIYGDQAHVTLGPEQHQYGIPWSAVSRIEPPRPEWADREGAVAITTDGRVVQLIGWWQFPGSQRFWSYDQLVVAHGPLTLLRDPAADHE